MLFSFHFIIAPDREVGFKRGLQLRLKRNFYPLEENSMKTTRGRKMRTGIFFSLHYEARPI